MKNVIEVLSISGIEVLSISGIGLVNLIFIAIAFVAAKTGSKLIGPMKYPLIQNILQYASISLAVIYSIILVFGLILKPLGWFYIFIFSVSFIMYWHFSDQSWKPKLEGFKEISKMIGLVAFIFYNIHIIITLIS